MCVRVATASVLLAAVCCHCAPRAPQEARARPESTDRFATVEHQPSPEASARSYDGSLDPAHVPIVTWGSRPDDVSVSERRPASKSITGACEAAASLLSNVECKTDAGCAKLANARLSGPCKGVDGFAAVCAMRGPPTTGLHGHVTSYCSIRFLGRADEPDDDRWRVLGGR